MNVVRPIFGKNTGAHVVVEAWRITLTLMPPYDPCALTLIC
jgi:hypothetical protein